MLARDDGADRLAYTSAAEMAERHLELLGYVRFGPEDSARVVAAHPWVAPHLPRISDTFYERIREHEEAHAVLRDEAQVERLRGSLIKWMADLFVGPHDASHFARAARIGEVHVQVGLPIRYMVSAMSVVREEFVRVLHQAARPRHATSVALLCDVELAVMLDSYWTHHTRKERELSRIARLAASAGVSETSHALEDLGVIVVGIDLEGRIVLFNDEAERTTGYDADELLGRHVTTLFPPDDRETIESRFRTARLHDAPVPFDGSLVTRAGRSRDVRARFKRVRADAESTALCAFLTATDVTEELELQRRTRQAERLAAIGRLAAGLAHEIRNPLNGAHLHLTLLERTLRKRGAMPGDEALDAVATVAHEVQRLSMLVTEFLQFARPQPLSLRATSIAEVCRHAVRILAPDAARERIDLVCDVPNTPVLVPADADKLAQVLMNLVRNAIEAIAADADRPDADLAGKVIVRARRLPREAVVEVEDDGPGIARSDAPIFDAFYSTKAAGTGLGLAIAHRIVQDHGGSITFESQPSNGDARGRTVFRIRLPLADAEAPTLPPEVSS